MMEGRLNVQVGVKSYAYNHTRGSRPRAEPLLRHGAATILELGMCVPLEVSHMRELITMRTSIRLRLRGTLWDAS